MILLYHQLVHLEVNGLGDTWLGMGCAFNQPSLLARLSISGAKWWTWQEPGRVYRFVICLWLECSPYWSGKYSITRALAHSVSSLHSDWEDQWWHLLNHIWRGRYIGDLVCYDHVAIHNRLDSYWWYDLSTVAPQLSTQKADLRWGVCSDSVLRVSRAYFKWYSAQVWSVYAAPKFPVDEVLFEPLTLDFEMGVLE